MALLDWDWLYLSHYKRRIKELKKWKSLKKSL